MARIMRLDRRQYDTPKSGSSEDRSDKSLPPLATPTPDPLTGGGTSGSGSSCGFWHRGASAPLACVAPLPTRGPAVAAAAVAPALRRCCACAAIILRISSRSRRSSSSLCTRSWACRVRCDDGDGGLPWTWRRGPSGATSRRCSSAAATAVAQPTPAGARAPGSSSAHASAPRSEAWRIAIILR